MANDFELENEPDFPEAFDVEPIAQMPTAIAQRGQFRSTTRRPQQAEGMIAVPSGAQSSYDKVRQDQGIMDAYLGRGMGEEFHTNPYPVSTEPLPMGDMLKITGPLGLPWAFWLVAGAALLGYWIAKSKFTGPGYVVGE